MDSLLSRLEPRTLVLLAGAAVLLLASALFSYLLLPDVRSYRQATAERDSLAQVAAAGTELKQELARLEAEIEELSHQLHGDTANLADRELEAFVVGRLQRISWENDVELVGVKPRKGDVVQIFREVLFDVQLSGTYFNVFRWLRTLTRDLGFVVVKHFQIRPVNEHADDPLLDVQLTVVSYRKAAT